jgi:cytochrome c553
MTSSWRSPALAIAMLACAVPPSSAQPRGDRAFGEYLSSECVTCHQISGRQVGAIPAIVGLPEDAFVALMESYRRRERDNQIMQTIAGRLSEEEVAALAAYFGSLIPQR